VFRYFTGTTRVVDRMTAATTSRWSSAVPNTRMAGVERNVTVHQLDADDPLTVEVARRLAQALIGATDEAEQMNGYDADPHVRKPIRKHHARSVL
jgi:hypothetical protein